MGQQIVQQPDGKYAIWSSVVDDFVVVDCENAEEVVDVMAEDSRREIDKHVRRVLEQLASGGRPYHQFTKTFGECLEIIREVHGDDAESLSIMECTDNPGQHSD